jgi:hypothetical protein
LKPSALSIILSAAFSLYGIVAYSQPEESPPSDFQFGGDVSVTNNGFSFIPTFTLGKPAVITNLHMGGEQFQFVPHVRFDLTTFEPWSVIIRWSYKVFQDDHFLVKAGAHTPGMAFVHQTTTDNGVSKEKLVIYRFLSPELWTTYLVNRTFSLGIYYLYGFGMEKVDQTKHTHYISLRPYFNGVSLGKNLLFSWNPQVYYLVLDGTDGFYAAQSFSLRHREFPVTLATMMNIKLDSDIESKDFDWNISLIYSFSNEFVRK